MIRILILGGFQENVDIQRIINAFKKDLQAEVVCSLSDKIYRQVKKTVKNISFESGEPDLILCEASLRENEKDFGVKDVNELLRILKSKMQKFPPVIFFTHRQNIDFFSSLRKEFPNCSILQTPAYEEEILFLAADLLKNQ